MKAKHTRSPIKTAWDDREGAITMQLNCSNPASASASDACLLSLVLNFVSSLDCGFLTPPGMILDAVSDPSTLVLRLPSH